MNFKKYLLAVVLLIPTIAMASWNPTTIKFVQMPVSGNAVILYFDTKVSNDDCPTPSVDTVGGIFIYETDARFEEIYARLLIAEQNNETIQILSTAGDCNQTSGYWLTNPYIRFGTN